MTIPNERIFIGKEKKSTLFDKLAKKFAEKMGQSVKEVAEPIKTQVTKKVDSKVDLYSRIIRLGVLVFLFIDGTKRVVGDEHPRENSSPNHIIINNYIDRKRDGED